jgi:hypothetical protein
MINKTFSSIIVILLVSATSLFSKNAISNYDTHKSLYTRKTLNPHYVGPIFATGGAMTDINRYITDMAPEKIGAFETNNLTIIDTINQVYFFNKVQAYTVTKNGESFSVLYMKSKMNNEKYEIIVEIKEGSNFDRTIWVYKNGVKKIIILWVDNSRIVQKKHSDEI